MMMNKNSMLATLAGALLASCVTHQEIPSYTGPVAPPQVAYRIDDHRYFEIVPTENHACFWANLFYVDTARDIRTNVTSWDRTHYGRLVIDAATDQYLISPIIGMEPGCHTGDYSSTMCDLRLRYSVDAGRTWKVTFPPKNVAPHAEVYLAGDAVYFSGHRARLPDLITGDGAWVAFPLSGKGKPPPLVKPPVDNEPACDESKTIKTP
jgi:hypothetical protein